jgi:hypothetical protein
MGHLDLALRGSNSRCTINDGAKPSIAAEFYQGTERSIDRCRAAQPAGTKYDRHAEQVFSAGLKGAETRWVYGSNVRRF